jgi:hypothetical protein
MASKFARIFCNELLTVVVEAFRFVFIQSLFVSPLKRKTPVLFRFSLQIIIIIARTGRDEREVTLWLCVRC